MLAPHPAGSGVHRGYSWPGLEKVSNLMGDEEDVEEVKRAEREVGDVKVCVCVCVCVFFFVCELNVLPSHLNPPLSLSLSLSVCVCVRVFYFIFILFCFFPFPK